jgi:A/G-specific adenine glycosylase
LLTNETKIVRALLAWFAGNARDLPWRRTRDPYAIWVSEIMLQQTQVMTVVPYWERWMRELPDISALAGASPERLHKLWEGLGYYTRVRNLQEAARLVMEKYDGEFPRHHAQILELPGIGLYTAGAICSIAFNQPKPILDGNAVRVLSRVFGIAGDTRKANTRTRLWRIAEELVLCAVRQSPRPNRPASAFNQALMELGARVCTPRQTKCVICPIANECVAYREDRVQDLPRLGPRVRATPRHFVAFVLQQRGRFLVRQRPAGVVNGHLWEFPNVELALRDPDANHGSRRVRSSRFRAPSPSNSLKAGLQTEPSSERLRQAARRVLGWTPRALEPLCTIRHSITRYRMTLQAYRVMGSFVLGSTPAQTRWVTPNQLRHLAFPSAHKRILRRLGIQRPAAYGMRAGQLRWKSPPHLPASKSGSD